MIRRSCEYCSASDEPPPTMLAARTCWLCQDAVSVAKRGRSRGAYQRGRCSHSRAYEYGVGIREAGGVSGWDTMRRSKPSRERRWLSADVCEKN